MSKNLKRGTLLVALLASAAAAGCAQDIGDIDRTAPDRVKKSDLETGSWWMHQKVVEVPGSSSLEAFEGMMMDTEKVTFVAEENYLIAYRSYPILPGSDDQNLNVDGQINYEEIYGEDYRGNVLAIFPIKSHFDVQREYDPATGEQSNVITENMSDRPWYDRDFIHVSWHENPIVNFEWFLWNDMSYELGYVQSEGEDDPKKAAYFEYDNNGQLVYFDAPATYIIQTTVWDWFYSLLGYEYADGRGAVEVRVVTSFGKDLGSAPNAYANTEEKTVMNLNYEPLDYPNQDMNRFGYFRTERYTYDPRLGFMNSGRIELANRHNIWKRAYNDDGSVIPVESREIRSIPYYIFDDVKEPLLSNMAAQVIDEWNVAFKRAVYLMQHPTNTEIGGINLTTTIQYETLKPLLSSATYPNGQPMSDVFVACHVPVRAGDNVDVCGPVGYSPREGDFRRNFLWLVNQRQDVGLLGYCPSVTDPLTGQTISAQAHVYTAPMNEIANSIVDQIKFAKGELTPEGVRDNDANIARARHSRERFIDMSKMSDKVRVATLNSPKAKSARVQKNAERDFKVQNLRKFDYTSADSKLKAVIDSGLLASDIDSAILNSAAKMTGAKSVAALSDQVRDAASLYNQLSFKNRSTLREMQKAMGAKGYCFKDTAASYDLFVSEMLNRYRNRDDYDNIFNEIRAQIFRSTALHEMGHGFGLRHNHTGSFDSMNYFDKYWELRGRTNHSLDPNFWREGNIDTVGKLYSLYDYTDAQLNGGMLNNMYSSIMDYSSGNLTDLQGLGKYDHAAILYAYSAGTSVSTPGVTSSNGLVEIFSDNSRTLPATRDQMGHMPYDVLTHKDTTDVSTFDDQTSVGQPYLELVHFRDFFKAMDNANYDFIHNRKLERLPNYLAHKGEWVRVPYLFCTDDNRGALRSCHVFDHGADYFEQVSDVVRTYRVNYWFTNFARGRAFWDSWGASGGYQWRFFFLSDLFQSWYIGNRSVLEDVLGDETSLIDETGEAAAGASFNFLASVLATPEYGLYCKRFDNGQLFGLSADDEARQETSEFYLRSRCGENAEYYYVRQGDGRRRYQKYDVSAGFDYSMYEYELEHNMTSLWAILALLDNEATVIADSGDMGTYTFGMYDYYSTEMINLANGMLAEDYTIHAPRLVSDDGDGNLVTTTYQGEETVTGDLVYPAMVKSRFYATDFDDAMVEYDPLTGREVAEFDKLGASVPMFGKCKAASDCAVPNDDAWMYCGQLFNDNDDDRCVPIFSSAAKAACPAGSTVEAISRAGDEFACLPNNLNSSGTNWNEVAEALTTVPCSDSHPSGYCGTGKVCVTGVCKNQAPRVEADTSLTQKYYLTLYGMLMTGPIGMDPTFYDQFNIYRKGSGQENTPSSDYETVTFENPYTGEVFAANRYVCKSKADGSYPAWCYTNNQIVQGESGAVLMLETANKRKELVEKYWDEYITYSDKVNYDDPDYESSAAYQTAISSFYKWNMTKYDLQYSIRDINFTRNAYDAFGSVW